MPLGHRYHNMVASPDKKSIYTVGALSRYGEGDNIYQLTCTDNINDCKWTLMETTLKSKRFRVLAFPITNDVANKICNAK